jgi:hypothetical protein
MEPFLGVEETVGGFMSWVRAIPISGHAARYQGGNLACQIFLLEYIQRLCDQKAWGVDIDCKIRNV